MTDIKLGSASDIAKCGKQNQSGRIGGRRYWLTPPDLYNQLNKEFHFTYDPCPYPVPKGFNSLVEPWGHSNFVNPPFHKVDGGELGGPTTFVRKAISEHSLGHSSVLLLPIPHYVALVVNSGAAIRTAGRVRWIDCETGQSLPKGKGSEIGIFILKL